MSQTTDSEKMEAIKHLRKLLKPGATVYCVLRHISNSGMSRRIDFYAIVKNQPHYLSGYIATITGYRRHKSEQGLVVGGCGMDMGFAVVYDLSRCLYPKGFKLKGWRRNSHAENGCIDSDYDGGYALKHSWL